MCKEINKINNLCYAHVLETIVQISKIFPSVFPTLECGYSQKMKGLKLNYPPEVV